jgi:hypothetical protein
MPLTLGWLVQILEGRREGSLWLYLFGYTALRFLQGSGGLSALQDVLCLVYPKCAKLLMKNIFV